MTKYNCFRKDCMDVLHSYLVHDARYEGELEIPVIEPESAIPTIGLYLLQKRLILMIIINGFIFIKMIVNSLYRDMPLVMQAWNTYRGKALGHWWQSNGLTVLPNVRTGDERTYNFSCSGIKPGGTACVGSYGCLRFSKERNCFID